MSIKLSIDNSEFRAKLRRAERRAIVRAERLAELIASEIVNYARDTGGYGTQPPARPGEGPRQAHPGGWADITSNLANSIKGRVERKGLSVTAIIEATEEYAAELDAKEGYDVLGGAEIIARAAIKKHAPQLFDR